jgi:hypothetical protein
MGAPTYLIDEKLKEWATPRQIEFIDAVNLHRSMRKAEMSLGIHRGIICESMTRLRKKAAIFGYSPGHNLTRPVAPGQRLRGASLLYKRGEPEPLLAWVKSSADDEAREAIIREVIRSMSDEVRGRSPLVDVPSQCSSDLLTVIPLGDPHIGMYAWSREAGDDFDLEIARRLTLGAVDRLVASSPMSDTCVILPLGDVFHADDQTNQTPAHKHQLDVDSRYVKVLGVGIEMFRHAVLRALEKHRRVIVRFVSGNHDPHSVWALAFTISAYFANEPRVEVDLSPSKFWFLRFGSVLIGATHGDTIKHDKLLGVMACDRAKDWGETTHRYWYTGHIHQTTVNELQGVKCESFRTLAAKDAYAAGHGYRAGRDMVAIVHHREHGEIERHRCDVGMLAAE